MSDKQSNGDSVMESRWVVILVMRSFEVRDRDNIRIQRYKAWLEALNPGTRVRVL